jgi:chromosome segregation ATPase
MVPERLAVEQTPVTTTGSKRDWWSALTAIAQSGLLLLAIFGYFYSVLPVFRHQLLEERAARLTLEKEQVETELESLRVERSAIESEIANLSERLSDEQLRGLELETKVRESESSQRVAGQQAEQARREAEEVRQELEALNAELESLRWERLFFLMVTVRGVNTSKQFSAGMENYGEMAEFFESQKSNWPDPYENLRSAIDLLTGSRAEQEEFDLEKVSKLKQLVDERRDELACPMPDFKELSERLEQETARAEEEAIRETEEEISGLVRDYEQRGERVMITDEYRSTTLRSYRFRLSHAVEQRYRDEVLAARSVCQDLENSVWDSIQRQFERENLEK